MAEAKTQRPKRSVDAFLKDIPNEQKRQDACKRVGILRRGTKAEPVRLDDVDLPALRKRIKQSLQHMKKTCPG